MRDITFQSVFDTPSVKQAKMNELAITPDGRIWTYLYATEIISQYHVTEQPAVTGVDTVSSAASPLDSTKYVYITEGSAGWTVGDYEDHWMVVDDGTGEGQLGKIKGNTADTLELYFAHAFTTALAVADSDITIVHQPDAEEMDASGSVQPLNGVAQVAFAAADYGWFLVKGIGGVTIGDTAGEAFEPIVTGDNSAGHANGCGDDFDVEDHTIIGNCLVANSTADKATLCLVNIQQ